MLLTYRRVAELATERLGRPVSASQVGRAVAAGVLRVEAALEGVGGAVVVGVPEEVAAGWTPVRRGRYPRKVAR